MKRLSEMTPNDARDTIAVLAVLYAVVRCLAWMVDGKPESIAFTFGGMGVIACLWFGRWLIKDL